MLGVEMENCKEKNPQEVPAGTRQIFLYVLLEKRKEKKCSSSFHSGKIKMTPREGSELSLETSFYLYLLWPPAAFPQAQRTQQKSLFLYWWRPHSRHFMLA